MSRAMRLDVAFGDVYEFLAAFFEFMQLDPPWKPDEDPLEFVKETFRSIIGDERREFDRATLLLLYRLGLLLPCVDSSIELKVFRDRVVKLCPTTSRHRDVSKLVEERILEWHPVRLLVRYLALRRGVAHVEDIVRDLGCTMKRLTSELYDALSIVVPRNVLSTPSYFMPRIREICGDDVDTRGVLKPFNAKRIKELLVPLLKSLGIVECVSPNCETIALTDRGFEYARSVLRIPDHEVVVTEPLFPQTYAALLATLYRHGKRIFIVSPWIERLYGKPLLTELLKLDFVKGASIYVVLRDDEDNRRFVEEFSKQLHSIDASIGVYMVRNLHAKLYASIPALITSANLLLTSIEWNYEVGVYYTVAPRPVVELVDTILSAARRVL